MKENVIEEWEHNILLTHL